MRDGSSGLLPGCGKPAVASPIIWLIATAPALGAVVTPGVAGAGAGDLMVLTPVASSIIWLIATAPALGAVVTPGIAGAGAGDLTVLTLVGDGVVAEGVTILAGLTVRGVA
ncbi:MAG: hypothetical protein EHM35_04215, partial [Planctomycetaceae bacterium]